MSKYHNDNSHASDPGQFALAPHRFRRLEPAARGLTGWLWRQFWDGRSFEELLDEHLNLGDTRAAMVVATQPLVVAAYTDELDCVALLGFPEWLVGEFALRPGTRLLTVNTYETGDQVMSDLVPGPEDTQNYVNFFPVIADFFSDDQDRIVPRKAQIDEREWRRCQAMASEALERCQGRWRNGSPLYSFRPAT
ncbi:MAG TPA: hypothetical protein VFV87_16685 [Pirellulaceae bacterium]|nr:hypothetical protein [Pirellulaceae bacterium]